jgi:hypothetical protein
VGQSTKSKPGPTRLNFGYVVYSHFLAKKKHINADRLKRNPTSKLEKCSANEEEEEEEAEDEGVLMLLSNEVFLNSIYLGLQNNR